MTKEDIQRSQASLETFQEQAKRVFPEQGRLTQLQDELAGVETRLQGEKETDQGVLSGV